MLIPEKELNFRKPDIKSAKTQIYFLDDNLLAKRFTPADKDQLKRYEYSKNITNLSNVSLPIDILETEKGFCGYIEKVLPGTFNGKLKDFAQYYNKHRYTITLKDITDYILKCSEIVANCHENGIVNPDLASEGNVLYNEDNFGVYFIDYQDMQVGNIQTNVINSFIYQDPVLFEDKYYYRGIYNPNIDLYTLTVLYFYYATLIIIPNAIQTDSIDKLLKMAGIENTYFAYCLQTLYNPNVDNIDIRLAIEELCSEYKLSPFKNGKVRKLIKKQ